MKVPKRYYEVREASRHLEDFILNLIGTYDLTYGELFTLLGEQVSRTAKYLVRQERDDEEDGEGEE